MRLKHARTKWWPALTLLAAAIAMFVLGLAYGVFTVGVPSQDPPPWLAARELRDLAISGWGMSIGFGMGAIAVIWLLVVAWSRRRSAVA